MTNSEPVLASLLRFAILIYNIILVYIESIAALFKPPPKKDIRGQNALITGSGHGLGRELAIKFARQGCNLILVDINEANNQAVRRELEKAHLVDAKSQRVHTYSLDIRDEAKVAELAKKVRQEVGDVDILVNNAGIVQCLPFFDLNPALVERTFQVNVLAHIWTIKHFLPSMMKNQRGHIVAIASIAGLFGSKYLTDYCASKFAVVGLMDSLTKEIHDKGANQNVHLTTVCPACMSTGMFQNFTTRFSWLLPVLNAELVAKATLQAVLTNKPFIAVPTTTMFFSQLASVIPIKAGYLIQDFLDYGVKPHKN